VENAHAGGAALEGSVTGVGPAVRASTSGSGSALVGEIANAKNSSPALSGVTSGTGSGVSGSSDSGVGVRAASAKGTALEVDGKVTFSRSGIATVPTDARRVKVDLAGVSSDSMVFATIQQLSGAVAVANVVAATSAFTIHLSDAAPQALRVAWMVLD
jgi:hypothetical protein